MTTGSVELVVGTASKGSAHFGSSMLREKALAPGRVGADFEACAANAQGKLISAIKAISSSRIVQDEYYLQFINFLLY
jgi:hypothetical protein